MKRALAVLDDADLIRTADFVALLADRYCLRVRRFARANVLAGDLLAVQVNFERIIGRQLLAGF